MFDDEIDDDDDLCEGRDYKMAWQRRNLRYQALSVENWIYVGVDVERPWEAKVGKTTGNMNTRSYGSQNPRYAIKYAFKLRSPFPLPDGASDEVLREQKERNRVRVSDIEDTVKEFLALHYRQIRHHSSGMLSEWFVADPNCLASMVAHCLNEHFPHEVIRVSDEYGETTMLECWENPALLKKSALPGYQERGLFKVR